MEKFNKSEENKIIKKNNLDNKIDNLKKQELILNILKVKQDLDFANRSFEHAEDELIDYYIYQIMANKSKLDYLLKKAKKYGLRQNCNMLIKYII